MPAWGRKKKRALTAQPVEPELPITAADDTVAPTLMLLPEEPERGEKVEKTTMPHEVFIPEDKLASETAPLPLIEASDELSILGDCHVDVERMYRFVLTKNPDFDRSIAEAFYELGRVYGIRGDVALCQSLIETGWFKFTGGTAVTPDQHNYCGLGVTLLGLKGHSFDTVEEGVRAQLQHLYAYASKDKVPEGEKIVDPRFALVKRGVAPTWRDLNGRWAANKNYASSIMRLYREMLDYNIEN